jgi:hypothetical protein
MYLAYGTILTTSRQETAAPDVWRIAGFDFRWRVPGTRTHRSGSHGDQDLMTQQLSSAGVAARSTPVPTAQQPLLWMLALFLVTLPAVNMRLYASDEVQYFAFLRSLWFDRDLSFDNEYRALYDRGVAQFAGFRETHLETVTETGRRLNFGTLGPAILWAPF